MIESLKGAFADRYRIERELGAGGMATVYLAHDLRHDRKVALKVLRPELSAVIGAARFLVEIKTTANLQHPHILPLHDSGEVEGTVYYVMPYVEGESLRDRLNRDKQLPIDEAIRITTEVAGALDYAHRHNVIHRDIKPENILLQQDGHAMVADFGIALAAARSDGGSRMTETGMSLGTPHYMSPEQAMGEREISAKADVYALGCVLYEMLCGEPPFTGPSAQAIVARVITEEPRSLTLQRRTVPRHVEAAVKVALAKLPADRFASARAFADALNDQRFGPAPADDVEPSTAPISMRRGRLGIAGWAAAAVALATLGGGFMIGRGTSSEPRVAPVHFTIDLPDSMSAVNRCCGRAQALSPDGSTLVFVGMKGSRGNLYRRQLNRLDAEVIPGTEDGATPFFSPDGQWLGFESAGKLRKVAVSGGPAIPIATAAQVWGASWGEGDVIVFGQDTRLYTVPASGGQPRPITSPDSASRHFNPFVLPGGKAALFSMRAGAGGAETGRIGIVELSSGKVDTLGFGMSAEYASGYLVFTGSDNTLLVQPFNPSRRKTTGPATVILSGITLHGGATHEFSLSTNGWLEYQKGAGQSMEVLRASGPGGRTAIPLPGRTSDNLEDPAFSPDGRRIVVRLIPDGLQGQADLWLLDRQQGTLTRFTVGGGSFPVWSRDGRTIAYTVTGDSVVKAGIYSRSIHETSAPLLVLAGRSFYPASWLPNGRSLVFSAGGSRPTKFDIGIITLGDSVPRWILNSEFNELNPQVSPDGRRLAYVSDRSGDREIYVQPMAGGATPTQISTDGAMSPRWSPDGRTLYYVVNPGSIVAATFAPGAGIAVTSRRVVMEGGITDLNNQNVNWDISPDGKQFLYIDNTGAGAGGPIIAVIQNWVELVRAMRSAR